MAKHLIIDGYNLLGARGKLSPKHHPDMESLREELLRELSLYGTKTAHAVSVVFDGWQQGMGSEHHEHRAGVQVLYSRRGEQADQVIQRLARQYGADCAVVSSDREVMDHARAQGAFIMRADEFDRQLRKSPVDRKRSRPAVGLGEKDESEILRRPNKKGNPKKLPKSVRKRQRKLNSF